MSHEFSEFWLEFFHELLKFFRETCNSDRRIATGGWGLDPQLFFKTIFLFRNCGGWGERRAKNSHIYNFVANENLEPFEFVCPRGMITWHNGNDH